MKVIKKTAEYTIVQKRNTRYGVKNAQGKWINGDDKVKVLLAEDLIKLTAPAAPEATEEPAAESEEAPGDEQAETEDTPAEDKAE